MSTDFFARYERHLAAHGINYTAQDFMALATGRAGETGKHAARPVLSAIERVNTIEDDLREHTARIRSTLTSVEANLDEGRYSNINSLGELQGSGLQYELACAQLETAMRALRDAARAFKDTENSVLDLSGTISEPTA